MTGKGKGREWHPVPSFFPHEIMNCLALPSLHRISPYFKALLIWRVCLYYIELASGDSVSLPGLNFFQSQSPFSRLKFSTLIPYPKKSVENPGFSFPSRIFPFPFLCLPSASPQGQGRLFEWNDLKNRCFNFVPEQFSERLSRSFFVPERLLKKINLKVWLLVSIVWIEKVIIQLIENSPRGRAFAFHFCLGKIFKNEPRQVEKKIK